MDKTFAFLLAAAILSGCVETSVIPVAQNQIIINTSAAPICGGTGSQNVAVKMAAVEALRRGYDRFIILGVASENNTGVFQTGPTYATTTTTLNTYGNYGYGQSNTQFGGGSTIVYGTHDSSLGVLLLKRGDRDYDRGVDAKQTLGEKWQEIAEKGVATCG
jgi:hypothetical protein